MSMRLVYLLAGQGKNVDELKRREGILNEVAAGGTQVVIETLADGPAAIECAMDEYRALPLILQWISHNQHKYDAVILGCAGDAGMEGAREIASIPVVGPGESSILLGTRGDKRFSMITTSLARAAIKRRLVRDAGLSPERLISSHSVGIPVLEMYTDKARTQAGLINCMNEAKALGSEAMLLGCMTLAFMDRHLLKEAEQITGLPLINPVVTAVKMAEAQVAMRRF